MVVLFEDVEDFDKQVGVFSRKQTCRPRPEEWSFTSDAWDLRYGGGSELVCSALR